MSLSISLVIIFVSCLLSLFPVNIKFYQNLSVVSFSLAPRGSSAISHRVQLPPSLLQNSNLKKQRQGTQRWVKQAASVLTPASVCMPLCLYMQLPRSWSLKSTALRTTVVPLGMLTWYTTLASLSPNFIPNKFQRAGGVAVWKEAGRQP